MTDTDTRPAGRAGLRKGVLDRCVAMLDRHLPESGELVACDSAEIPDSAGFRGHNTPITLDRAGRGR